VVVNRQGGSNVTLGKFASKRAETNRISQKNFCGPGTGKSYLGGLGRGQGFGKLTPPKATDVLRSFTRELISMVFAGNSLRGTGTGGGITIHMSSSGKYILRGREETFFSFGFRNRDPLSMHRDTRKAEVAGEMRWQRPVGCHSYGGWWKM